MASPLSQKERLLSLATPLGADVLCIQQASINERLSNLFVMHLEMIADHDKASSVKAESLLGQSVTLTVELPGKKKRYFNGIVSRFAEGHRDERFVYFHAEVVPQIWLLTLKSNCRVFQDKSIPDILKQVLQGIDIEDKLQGSFTKIDYCVQYRETDFNFISRLMEEEGIYYYFKHADGKHTLVLSNNAKAEQPCPNLSQARFLPQSGMGEWEDGVQTFEHRKAIVPGKFTFRDYQFQMPDKSLETSAPSPINVANNSKLEIYDYPGEYAQRFNKPDQRMGDVEKEGHTIAQWRIEEQASDHLEINGTSTCRAMTTGTHFSLLGEKSAEIKVPGTSGKYLLAAISHAMLQTPEYVSGEAVPGAYTNSFTCVPQDKAFRPARKTPRPVVQGLQTAVVVGLKGEEIDCDKYGRVKVQFHWDREGKKDENSSCWVRVGTPIAGNQWGMVHIPRIGQEVIVAFLEGDPDQPLIVGSVYNYDQMPPYKLPDNKTQSGLKTRSTKQGDQDTFNELRFEDQKGKEHIYLHAQRNMVRIVENFDLTKVGNPDVDVTAKEGSQAIAVRDIQHTMVGFADDNGPPPNGNQKLDVWNNQKIKIGYGEAQASDGSQTLEIYKDRTTTLQMGDDSLQLKMGNQTTKLDLGKSETEALQSIELKVGQSSIKIDQTGVTIKGMKIQIEGQMMTQINGTMTQVQGSGMLQLGGGIMMLG
jgi:type VI secretion system secreted protein VgrG